MAMRAIELIESGFEDSEFLYPYYRLQEAGYEVVVAGTQAHATYEGKHGVPVKADVAASEVFMEDFDLLIVPGGRAPDYMRRNADMVRLVIQAFAQGKPVGSICHGPQLLIEADVLRGRRLTCYDSVKTDVKNAGGVYSDSPVVVDGNLVTSRKPADLPDFMRAVLAAAGPKKEP